MKNKHLRHALLFLTTAFVAASCAKKEEVSFETLELRSLDAWMSMHAPDAVRWDNGMYFELLEAGTGSPIQAGEWARIDFTGTNLQGDVFVTRYRQIAEEQGITNSRFRTRYEPLYTILDEANTALTPAQIATLMNGMKEGDSVRIYFPSHLGYGSYGSSYGYGYEGQTALGANRPGIMTMKLVEIVADPNFREKNLVHDFAATLGVDEPMIHSEGAYGTMVLDSLMYARITEPADVGADTIRKDSTVHIYYKGMFLDGFIFDTNIDSVALRVFRDNTAHDPLEYTPDTDRSSYVEAFYRIFDSEIPVTGAGNPTRVRYGDRVKMVFTSPLGYGIDGSTPSDASTDATVIQSFTPLIFEFYAGHPDDE